MSVLIIGGGIGGLAAAVALRRVGIAARVFERAPEIHEVGAALSVFSNAVKALQRMGLEEQIRSLGPELIKVSFLSASGRVLSSTNVQEVSRACGAASLVVHRADLQQMLLEALDADQVITGKEYVGIVQDEDGVTVRFADQTEARGQITIGADGVRSTVAASLFGDEHLRFAGYYCYWAMAETPDVPTHEGLYVLLPGIQFGLIPEVRPGETYWFLCRNAAIGTSASDTEHDHLTLLRSVAGQLPGDLGDMVARTDAKSLVIDDVFDRPRRKAWGRGRVSLLGDAAHPTTPTFGQGACMAIEDAVVLADSLRRAEDPVAGLRAYENRRLKRTTMITKLSWRYGNIMQYEHPALVKWRTLTLATPFHRWMAQRILRRSLSFDAPELSGAPSMH